RCCTNKVNVIIRLDSEQKTLLSDVGIQRDLIPVGREVAGVVLQVGPKVTFFQPEDEVVGILPLDSTCSGLCDVVDIDEHYLVQKPEKLSSVCVAAALRDGLSAYTALHTHARIAAGHTLLVMDGGSSFGLMCIQLACYHGVKVLTTSHSPQQHTFLEQVRPSVARVIPVYNNSSDLLPVVLEETGGLGVDIVIDSGVCLQEEEEEEKKFLPHKHDIISVLGVGGHWVTSHQDLQLDPPDCRLLHLKSASVSFLNPEVWTASSAQQGRYLRILPMCHLKHAQSSLQSLGILNTFFCRYSERYCGENVNWSPQVTRILQTQPTKMK
uniref:Enoyl reductase (ER) domain-containing protein n=1 Tax=Amphiprion ocellaris TaxID=80972 RepID=A0AAQ5YJT2_AMPOC